jgi:hypothetical protein
MLVKRVCVSAPNGKIELCSEKLWNRRAPGLSLSLIPLLLFLLLLLLLPLLLRPSFSSSVSSSERVLSLCADSTQTRSNGIYLPGSTFKHCTCCTYLVPMDKRI